MNIVCNIALRDKFSSFSRITSYIQSLIFFKFYGYQFCSNIDYESDYKGKFNKQKKLE